MAWKRSSVRIRYAPPIGSLGHFKTKCLFCCAFWCEVLQFIVLMANITKTGFTVVELLIVIVVIGILATLSMVGYKGLQAKALNGELMVDANSVSDSLEGTFLRNNKFPADLAELGQIKKGANTLLSYQSNGVAYCLAVTSSVSGLNSYTVRDDANLKQGTCAGWVPSSGGAPLSPPAPTIGSVAISSFVVSWASVSGATGYVVKYGTPSATTTASCTSSPCTINGLSASTTYQVTVTATNATANATSAAVSATTLAPLPAPSTPSVTYTKSTVTISGSTYRRYAVTASGGTCSVGTTEWKITVTGGVLDWSTVAWQSANTKNVDVPTNGIISPDDQTIYAKPRCVSGPDSTEGATATAISGTGGSGGGAM